MSHRGEVIPEHGFLIIIEPRCVDQVARSPIPEAQDTRAMFLN